MPICAQGEPPDVAKKIRSPFWGETMLLAESYVFVVALDIKYVNPFPGAALAEVQDEYVPKYQTAYPLFSTLSGLAYVPLVLKTSDRPAFEAHQDTKGAHHEFPFVPVNAPYTDILLSVSV